MTADSQEQSPLFGLPPEVRDKIYGFLLAFRHADFEYSLRPDFTFLPAPEHEVTPDEPVQLDEAAAEAQNAAKRNYIRNFRPSYHDALDHLIPKVPPPPPRTPHTKPLPSAMLACKRLYHELAPQVHHSAVVRATLQGRHVGVAVHGLLRAERLWKVCVLVAMEHANWNGWLRFVGEVFKRAGKGLREVVVDWEPRVSSSSVSGGENSNGGGQRKGYLAGQEARMEERFFGLLAACEGLETLKLYGNLPKRWGTRIRELCGERVRVIITEGKWWVDDESDAGVSIGPVMKYVDKMSVASRV